MNPICLLMRLKVISKRFGKAGICGGFDQKRKEFPTGLMTKNFNIAIPHADPENVNAPFIYILRLAKPIVVEQMADREKIKVKDVFILGIKDGRKQVDVLAALMNLFMNDAFAQDFWQQLQLKKYLLVLPNIYKLIKKVQ
ncbi:PTS sugar transporter subunit IIA [Lactobacillus sp. R2/2]|nr:PTS sugar transporter subunit IIA [Lactobacillus sp. R2/2]